MIDLFTSALSDCQNAFSILCEVFNSIEAVTLSIIRELNPIPHGVFWITHTWGGADSARPPCNTVILKDMDLKFGMLK